MTFTDDHVRHIATLARLELEEEEQAAFRHQLSAILEYIGKLSEVDTDAIEPMSHSVAMHCALRDDAAQSCDPETRDAALELFPESESGLLKVPPVFS